MLTVESNSLNSGNTVGTMLRWIAECGGTYTLIVGYCLKGRERNCFKCAGLCGEVRVRATVQSVLAITRTLSSISDGTLSQRPDDGDVIERSSSEETSCLRDDVGDADDEDEREVV